MSAQDNRIRFSSTKIDFETDVGETGQRHDTYPAPGEQPRFDWMRMFLIGLLANQSSESEPTQYRQGTIWFDSTTLMFKVRVGSAWVSLSEAIQVATDVSDQPVTLQDLYTTVAGLIGNKPTATFSGSSSSDGIVSIPIPASLRSAAGAGSRPLVFVNGLLADPRKCTYAGGATPTSIALSGGVTVDADETFTVLMLSISESLFLTSGVSL